MKYIIACILGLVLWANPLFSQLIGEKIPPVVRLKEVAKDPEAVVHLNMRQQELYTVPFELKDCSNLQILNLMKNKIATIPTWFCDLNTLYELNLRQNKFEQLPACMNQLENLLHLKVEKNKLDARLFDALAGLNKLEHLYAQLNRIEAIPANFNTLSALRNAYFSDNRIETITPKAFKGMDKLEILNLSGNKLSSVPNSITQLQGLKNLILAKNELETIPVIEGGWKSLTVLDLGNNNLKTLPDLAALNSLEILIVSFNPLSELSHAVSNLQNLKQLFAVETNISDAEKERLRELLPNCVMHF